MGGWYSRMNTVDLIKNLELRLSNQQNTWYAVDSIQSNVAQHGSTLAPMIQTEIAKENLSDIKNGVNHDGFCVTE